MPLAHTCASCGHDLSRLPAHVEAVYRLPVVICPECGTPVVRRSDGHRIVPRRARYRVLAVQRLIRSSLLLGLFSLGLVAACIMLHATLEDHRINLVTALFADSRRSSGAAAWRFQLGYIALGFWVAFTLAAGAYLTNALPHRSRLRVIGVWLIPIILILAVPLSAVTIDDIVRHGRRMQPIDWSRLVSAEDRRAAMSFVQTIAATVVLLPLGIPLGRGARRISNRVASQRFRKLRRRIVTRRQRA